MQASRAAHPARRRFEIHRIIGSGDLWVTEYVLTYDNRPSFTVSVMEFSDGKVARETQYFGDPFPAPSFLSRWVERAVAPAAGEERRETVTAGAPGPRPTASQ